MQNKKKLLTCAISIYTVLFLVSILNFTVYHKYWVWNVNLAIWLAVGLHGLKIALKIKSKGVQRLFLSSFLFYPVLGTLIKFMILNNTIAYSWLVLNRIEHFAAAFFLGFLVIPYLIKMNLFKTHIVIQFFAYTGFIIFLGNLNEFIEYFFRQNLTISLYKTQPDDYGQINYWDTIIDLILNMFAAVVSYIIIHIEYKK